MKVPGHNRLDHYGMNVQHQHNLHMPQLYICLMLIITGNAYNKSQYVLANAVMKIFIRHLVFSLYCTGVFHAMTNILVNSNRLQYEI